MNPAQRVSAAAVLLGLAAVSYWFFSQPRSTYLGADLTPDQTSLPQGTERALRSSQSTASPTADKADEKKSPRSEFQKCLAIVPPEGANLTAEALGALTPLISKKQLEVENVHVNLAGGQKLRLHTIREEGKTKLQVFEEDEEGLPNLIPTPEWALHYKSDRNKSDPTGDFPKGAEVSLREAEWTANLNDGTTLTWKEEDGRPFEMLWQGNKGILGCSETESEGSDCDCR